MAIMSEAGFIGCAAETAYTMRKTIAEGTERNSPVFLMTARKQENADG